MKKDYWINLLVDHLTGAATEESRTELAAWRNASEDNERLFSEMKRTWDALSLSVYDERFDAERAYRLFRERVKAETRRTDKPAVRRRLPLRRIAAVAAVLIPFVILSHFTWRYLTVTSVDRPLLAEVSVPNGSKTRMKLQDGSVVWLNAGSTMQYDTHFGKTHRNCVLSGEAYLEVAGNADLPFVVEAGDVTVKVLGTRFNMQAYAEDAGIKVSLLEGSVEMRAKNAPAIRLRPGEMADYQKANGQTAVSSFVQEHALCWMHNRFVFNGETFEQIIHVLERSFDVKVIFLDDRIKKHRFAGDFTRNESIGQIFDVMSAGGKFRYRMKGDTIEIR
jgi:ferric-dicitrate binding protein FerR (iron transport regulator)